VLAADFVIDGLGDLGVDSASGRDIQLGFMTLPFTRLGSRVSILTGCRNSLKAYLFLLLQGGIDLDTPPLVFAIVACPFDHLRASSTAAPNKKRSCHPRRQPDRRCSGPAAHNVTIVIRGNKIQSVSEGGAAPAGAEVINFDDYTTVLPGMIDAHTHIFLQGEEVAEEAMTSSC